MTSAKQKRGGEKRSPNFQCDDIRFQCRCFVMGICAVIGRMIKVNVKHERKKKIRLPNRMRIEINASKSSPFFV